MHGYNYLTSNRQLTNLAAGKQYVLWQLTILEKEIRYLRESNFVAAVLAIPADWDYERRCMLQGIHPADKIFQTFPDCFFNLTEFFDQQPWPMSTMHIPLHASKFQDLMHGAAPWSRCRQ